MLSYAAAQQLFEELQEKAQARTDESFRSHYLRLLEDAGEYAKIRLGWHFMAPEARREKDEARSILHDSFMLRLSIVCRCLGMDRVGEILPDRKTRGDFACYIALFLALEQR